MSEDRVYFAQQIVGGPVKIGVAWDIEHRLTTLAIWSPHPLKLLASHPGDRHLERNVHDCFADCHYHNEWFHPNPRLMAAIDAIAAGAPLAEVVDLNDRRGNVLGLTQRATRARRVAA